MRELLIKLTGIEDDIVLVGTESIITVKEFILKPYDKPYDKPSIFCTKIQLRGAMIETVYVKESPEEIFKLYKNEKNND